MRMRGRTTIRSLAAALAFLVLLFTALALTTPPVGAASRAIIKVPNAVGMHGAVATVDPDATRVGLEVLRKGGNAVDAAVAAAATLGVTEPYSAGIGGGGYLVYYDARARRVRTIDSRETAPAAFTPTTFTDAAGRPLRVVHLAELVAERLRLVEAGASRA